MNKRLSWPDIPRAVIMGQNNTIPSETQKKIVITSESFQFKSNINKK